MNVGALIKLAESSGIRIHAADGKVKLRGDATAIKALMPKLAEYKAQIIAYLQSPVRASEHLPEDCVGALRSADGGLYLPWGPYVDPGQLAAMQRDLLAAVEELARLERWPDEYFDHVAYCIERQPISTLRPDLAHFRARLDATRAEMAASKAAAARSWKFDGGAQ